MIKKDGTYVVMGLLNTDSIAYATGKMIELPGERIETSNSHGTGCTLSSAIAAGLARGLDLISAVEQAKAFITGALSAGVGYTTGKGHGPVHHFYDLWKEK